jgi:ElaB/YqjD/DUF883 family membrane-anchored ribosome-binding protein
MKSLPTILRIALAITAILVLMNFINEYSDNLNKIKLFRSEAEDAREEAEQAKSGAEDARDEIQDSIDDDQIRRLLNN